MHRGDENYLQLLRKQKGGEYFWDYRRILHFILIT
jgi:hypothetical protein